MNKSELIEAVAVLTDQPKSQVGEVFDALRDVMYAELKAGREVSLHGIGKFKVHRSKERNGCKNPKTGRAIVIPAKNRAKYYSSKSLDDTLNG
jgi:DNA-binding protein HU-beta